MYLFPASVLQIKSENDDERTVPGSPWGSSYGKLSVAAMLAAGDLALAAGLESFFTCFPSSFSIVLVREL